MVAEEVWDEGRHESPGIGCEGGGTGTLWLRARAPPDRGGSDMGGRLRLAWEARPRHLDAM